jgi:hypothetical protein
MKRIMVLILLFLFSMNVTAPCERYLYIKLSSPINFYEKLINAVTFIESRHGKFVYNARENAVGWFQIRQCRVDHYNKILGTKYVLNDFYNYELSREMFIYFARGKSYETAARAWCSGEAGTKKASEGYWEKIKSQL